MTRWLDYIPRSTKEYFKLFRLRRRYPSCDIYSPLISKGVILGQECLISRDVEIGPAVSIGDFSYVNAGSIIASGTIGKFCSIGYFCQIGMPEHPLNYLSTSSRIYGGRNIFGIPAYWGDYPSPPKIENDVWIGSRVLILQGVRVSHGAVVAGGAVVTKDVPPYAIVAGVPAKIIRYRFDDNVIKQLLQWQWWDLPVEELRAFKELFRLRADAVKSLSQLQAYAHD